MVEIVKRFLKIFGVMLLIVSWFIVTSKIIVHAARLDSQQWYAFAVVWIVFGVAAFITAVSDNY